MGSGSNRPFVYRLKYGRAETVAMAIMALYTGNIGMLMSLAQQMNSGMVAAGMGYTGMSGGGMGYGGTSGAVWATAVAWATGAARATVGWATAVWVTVVAATVVGVTVVAATVAWVTAVWAAPMAAIYNNAGGLANVPLTATGAGAAGRTDLTGSYLGAGAATGGAPASIPHVVPNPFDNTLIIQGTAEDIEEIKDLLRQLDVAPRQVLIDAKIYEVDLTGAFSAGVQSYLDKKDTSGVGTGRTFTALAGAAGLAVSGGALILQRSHELLGVLNASENSTRTRVVSAPSIIATDSIPATMNVGDQVPVATSQAVSPRSGQRNQRVRQYHRQPEHRRDAFDRGARELQRNRHHGDQPAGERPRTAAGRRQHSRSIHLVFKPLREHAGDRAGWRHYRDRGRHHGASRAEHGRYPGARPDSGLGYLFGVKSYNTSRTELIIFLTPRVIYDTNQMVEASDEIKSNLKLIQKLMKNE